MQSEMERPEPLVIELSPLEAVLLTQAQRIDRIVTDDPLEWMYYMLTLSGVSARGGHA